MSMKERKGKLNTPHPHPRPGAGLFVSSLRSICTGYTVFLLWLGFAASPLAC